MTITLTKKEFSMEQKEIAIPVENSYVRGNLTLLHHATGLVVFAHGSGSSRLSSRNQFVAAALNKANLSTLLFDLLTPEEEAVDEKTREFRFNIPLLAERLLLVTQWLKSSTPTAHRNIGYFGASTGAAAALIAAAQHPEVHAVVSRGGRPDLAHEALGQVTAPTLLIVGELDPEVIRLNESAFKKLSSVTKELHIIPHATHLFEEPGTLEEVAHLSAQWFAKFLEKKTID